MEPSQIRELSERALEALRCGDHVLAVSIADQLAAAMPDNPVVRAIRAQALLGSDASDEAMAEARRAVELDAKNEYAQRLLGLTAWRAGLLTLAQESLERALQISGRRGQLLSEYAWFMANERGPRLAEEAAKEAVDADDGSSTAWAALGLAQHRLHRRNEAEASLRRALRLDPNNFYAQSAMVVLLQECRQDAKAEALAGLLKDVAGTEDFVESVRQEAKQRQIAGMLVERQALPQPPDDDSPRRRAVWLVTMAIIIAGVCVLFQPDKPGAVVICVIAPLLFLWCLQRLFFR